MRGRDIALATLLREEVHAPCINYCWMTNSSFMSQVAGRDYWADPEGVFYAYLRHCKINLVPQWYFPGPAQRKLEQGAVDKAPRGGTQGIDGPEDILRWVDALPSDAQVEAGYDLDAAATAYGRALLERMARAEHEVLFLDSFGQADFMGGYTRWGYENYLLAMALYPDAMHRFYHHSALLGRLHNQAIALACERYGLAPFVYGGQDICTAKGPIAAPRLLRKIYFPELKWCLEPLIEHNIGIVWHCDGDIRPILDDLLGLGVMGLQGFEEEHGVPYADMVQIKDRQGRSLSIWGCVSVVSTLPHGSVADVKRAVERSYRLAGPSRGFVLSSTSSVMPEVPHENIAALFEYGREFGLEYLRGS